MTNAELALLSLLAEQPRHGYELEQVISDRGMRDWTEIGFSSIYYLLKKLESKGLLEGRPGETAIRGPARLVYHLTEAGQSACRQATYQALSVPQPTNSAFLIGLANLPALDTAEAGSALREYRDRLQQQRQHVQARWEQEKPGAPEHVLAMFDLSVTLLDAELQWLDRFMRQSLYKEDSAMAEIYTARKDPELFDVPAGQFLTYTGQGAPESEAFQKAVGALYGLAYTLKFKLKKDGQDFKVSALEGLWWVDTPSEWFTTPRSHWSWKLLIRMPEFVTEEQVRAARAEAAAKKKAPEILEVQFEPFTEGLVAQVMHLGPFSEERPTIDRLHGFIAEQGLVATGRHHEVYLSDFTRTAPEKLKTILRQPVARV